MKIGSVMLASSFTIAGFFMCAAPAVAVPPGPFTVDFTILEGAPLGSCAFEPIRLRTSGVEASPGPQASMHQGPAVLLRFSGNPERLGQSPHRTLPGHTKCRRRPPTRTRPSPAVGLRETRRCVEYRQPGVGLQRPRCPTSDRPLIAAGTTDPHATSSAQSATNVIGLRPGHGHARSFRTACKRRRQKHGSGRSRRRRMESRCRPRTRPFSVLLALGSSRVNTRVRLSMMQVRS